jgi:hypothetical protein
MKSTLYLCITGCIFGVMSFGHLVRAVLGLSIIAAGWNVPVWVSWLGCPASLILCVWAFTLARKVKPGA